jgi:hypothetical protein
VNGDARSPYRRSALREPGTRRRAWRFPSFRPRLAVIAATASVLVHGAALGASTLLSSEARAPAARSERDSTSGFYFVHPLVFYNPFHLPEHVQACFARTVIGAGSDLVFYPLTSPVEAYGYDAILPAHFQHLASHEVPEPGDSDADLTRVDVDECVRLTEYAGWSLGGRTLVRVARYRDGSADVQTTALDEHADHPGLHCCLRRAQRRVAASLEPGTETRYLIEYGDDGITLTQHRW